MTDLRSAALPPLGPDDHARGDPAAPLLIVYADFTCVHCAVAHSRLAGAPVRRVFRHFALSRRHPRALALACAAEAAARQGAFWELHDALFEDPSRADDPHLWEHVRRIGLDLGRFESDRRDPAVAQRVREQVQDGLRGGVSTTPTLVLDGELLPGPPSPQLLARLAAG
jgi:protein-disulfide isomerase